MIIIETKTITITFTEGELRALSAEVATDAEDLEVAKLKLEETADHVERVKFDLSVVEDAERLNLLVGFETNEI